MRLLVTGMCGQLGHDVMNELAARGHEGIGSDIAPQYAGMNDGTPVCQMPYAQLDITDEAAVKRVLAETRPDAVIHCAAWTAVDAAEEEENQPKARAINAAGTRYIAQASKLMYISTDYVFDGQGETPWQPDCEDYAPLNVYGQTKLEGEQAVREQVKNYFIVRIAWVFGRNGNNFVKTMLRLGQTHPSLRVVRDQIGTPTYTLDLARLLVDMVETEKYGMYHATNEGGYGRKGGACHYGGIWSEQGRKAVQQPAGQSEAGTGWLCASARLERRAEAVPIRSGVVAKGMRIVGTIMGKCWRDNETKSQTDRSGLSGAGTQCLMLIDGGCAAARLMTARKEERNLRMDPIAAEASVACKF